MTDTDLSHTRRGAIGATLLAAAAAALSAPVATARTATAGQTAPTGHEHDWDWLVGRWNVRHRQLKARLTGSTEWVEFNGTSEMWLAMGGLSTLDDNLLEKPDGTYRAVGVRAFDPKAGHWLIWWLDGRSPTEIEPPVAGGFKDGVGEFVGDDTLNGRPIKVRYRWSGITHASAVWEQAYSPDAGATWETNWIMQFSRAMI